MWTIQFCFFVIYEFEMEYLTGMDGAAYLNIDERFVVYFL